jgi:transposase
VLGISRQGDAMARHYLYEAANVLLTTVRRASPLKSWGLKLLKRRRPKRARVVVARKLAAGPHLEGRDPFRRRAGVTAQGRASGSKNTDRRT